MDSTINNGNNAFPVDDPVEALLQDHAMVRTLVDAYRNADSDTVRINTAEQALMLLETHALLEESIFYPRVRDVDAELIGHFEQDHQQTDEILVQLKKMSLNDPQAWQLFEQMTDMVLKHIEEEETQFFPKLQQAGIDMTALGLEMQAHEANLVHTQAQASNQDARQ